MGDARSSWSPARNGRTHYRVRVLDSVLRSRLAWSGDIKLYAAAASWLGPLHALEGALIAAVSGAVLALIWMIWTSGAKNVASTLAIAAARPSTLTPGSNSVALRKTLPYGVALAFGAIVAAWMPGLLL